MEWAALSGLVVLASSFGAPAGEPGGEGTATLDRPATEVVRLLHAVRTPTPPPLDEVAPDLAVLAPGELSLLFDVLATERVPPADDQPEQVLSEAQRALIVAAVGRLGGDVRGQILERLGASDDTASRAAALWLLGGIARVDDLAVLFQRAQLPKEREPDPRVDSALRATLAALARREHGTVDEIGRRRDELTPQLLRTTMFALGDARRGDAMPIFTSLLESRPELAGLALAQIRRLGPPTHADEGRALARAVRPYLDPRTPTLCQAAVQALADLGDVDSIPYLLELLGQDDGVMRDVAVWGLRRITGMQLAAEAGIWNDWYRGEEDWFASEWPKLRMQLTAVQPDQIAGAIQEMTQHRLFKNELALSLVQALTSVSPGIRTLTCVGLGDLGSAVVLPWLLDATTDRQPRVAAAATDAIQRITGLAPPVVPSMWGDLLVQNGYDL